MIQHEPLHKAEPISIDNLLIDVQRRLVLIDNMPIDLTSREFDLLHFFALHMGWALSKEQIYECVWHEASVGGYHAVENAIYRIRQKIEGSSLIIQTIIGYGYRIERKMK